MADYYYGQLRSDLIYEGAIAKRPVGKEGYVAVNESDVKALHKQNSIDLEFETMINEEYKRFMEIDGPDPVLGEIKREYNMEPTPPLTPGPAPLISEAIIINVNKVKSAATSNTTGRTPKGKIRKYPCPHAGCKFPGAARPGDLKRHLQTKNHQTPSVVCTWERCNHTFTRVDAMKRHVKHVHRTNVESNEVGSSEGKKRSKKELWVE